MPSISRHQLLQLLKGEIALSAGINAAMEVAMDELYLEFGLLDYSVL